MSRTLVVEPEAEAEIEQAARWYDRRRETAGADFLRAIDKTIGFLREYPEQYQIAYRQTRRALVNGYPYALFYTVAESHVIVLACIHTARDPNIWP
jgi:plasmid stabilization system protein ParE